jgi:DNA-binding transcriptional LysR family regulator
MGPERINLRQLEAFRAVVLSGTVSAASVRMNISQPAVSRLLSDLERSIGFELFERRKRRLYIRPEGQMLYRELEKSYVGLDKIARRAREIREWRGVQLRIRCMPALSLGLLPAAVKEFRKTHPEVSISLHIGDSRMVAEWTVGLPLDFGLAALPITQEGLTLDDPDVFPCVCVLPPGHELGTRQAVTPELLANEQFVSLGADSDLRHRVDQSFTGIRRELYVETTTSANALSMVALGLGVSIIDPFTALALPVNVARKRLLPLIPYEFAKVLPKGVTQSRQATAFIEILDRCLAEFRVALHRAGLAGRSGLSPHQSGRPCP